MLTSETQRLQQAARVAEFIDSVLAVDPGARIVVCGDLNDFPFSGPVQSLVGNGRLLNLHDTLPEGERYTYVFEGNSQALDHILVSRALADRQPEFDVVHVNSEFATQASDHDPMVARFTIGRPPVATSALVTIALGQAEVGGRLDVTDPDGDRLNFRVMPGDAREGQFLVSSTGAFTFRPAPTFSGHAVFAYEVVDGNFTASATVAVAYPVGSLVLQVLHCSDGEAGIDAVHDLPRFSAVLNRLRSDLPSNTLTLGSGDNWLPGPFYNAGGDPVMNAVAGIGVASAGRLDVAAMNAMGFQASAFGNHEFDAGTREISTILRPSGAWAGAQFPYLSCNLTFTTSSDLASMVVADGQTLGSSLKAKISGSVVATVRGERVGIVAATTPLLPSISSPGAVGVAPANPQDYAELAAIIQARVDVLRNQGITRIILLAHMQQYHIEADELAPRLAGVDLVIAGGSHAIFADGDDRLRGGDSRVQDYPLWRTSTVGEPVAVVNAGANWRYVGRFTAAFDAEGRIVRDSVRPQVNGLYATDAQGVSDLGAGALVNATVAAIAQAAGDLINVKDGDIYGRTEVFLNGMRTAVRSEETNLGDLTADANLFAGRGQDTTVRISLKNGGGIRDAIGTVGVGAVPTYDPPAANPQAGKQLGDISRLDIENSLRFNNRLALVTITAAQLKEILEHGVAASNSGATPGQFPQVGGVRFRWDPAATAQAVSATPAFLVTTAGNRIRWAVVERADGSDELVIDNGVVMGDPQRTFRLVTLDFLASGGDGYPFPRYAQEDSARFARVDLSGGAGSGFLVPGFEQQALAEHLRSRYLDAPFGMRDLPVLGDQRIQRLGATDLTESFVIRLYRQCLGRDPEPAGLALWSAELKAGRLKAADVVRAILLSQEFRNRGLDDRRFVETLYRAFFNRAADAGGRAAWIDALGGRVLREDVLYGFMFAQEFSRQARVDGLVDIDQAGMRRFEVRQFVRRFYQQCLGREPEEEGIIGWTEHLLDGRLLGGDVARGFIGSQEFLNRALPNDRFLDVLYRAFFDREPDQEGKRNWLEAMQNRDRMSVLEGFIRSQEFANLTGRYGILPYAPVN